MRRRDEAGECQCEADEGRAKLQKQSQNRRCQNRIREAESGDAFEWTCGKEGAFVESVAIVECQASEQRKTVEYVGQKRVRPFVYVAKNEVSYGVRPSAYGVGQLIRRDASEPKSHELIAESVAHRL